ncbi:MAG: CDP-alcohol phosphatidyltransferase family protein [Nanoarchaeota archaeon]|nr:CDP-alcohol phosphatidyltransferase family protein [Nanoarchaeota archaeon]
MGVIDNFRSFPNQITIFRLLVLPLLYYLAFAERPILFCVLFVMAGIFDTLDGYVARKYDLCSRFGSDLDQYVDDAILVSVVPFVFLLRPEIYYEQLLVIFGLIFMFIIDRLIINIKFGWKIRLHTYAGKIYERVNYIIIPIALFIDNYRPFFFLLMFIGYYTVIEEAIIYLGSKKLNINMKSLFFRRGD